MHFILFFDRKVGAHRFNLEIEEILKKIDNFVPDRARRSTRRLGQPFIAAQGWFAHKLARISLNQVMMWSLFFVIVSFFLRAIPGGTWLLIGSLIVFVLVAVVAGMIAAIFPARRAARLNVLEALQYE